MAIRNSKELGSNLILIARRLLDNQELLKLLVYTDTNPLSQDNIENPLQQLNKTIKIIPLIDEDEFNGQSKLVIYYGKGTINEDNTEFKILNFYVGVYTPLDKWILNTDDLRPFLIMQKVEDSLKNKKINGVGLINYKGFNLTGVTGQLSGYLMEFTINVYN